MSSSGSEMDDGQEQYAIDGGEEAYLHKAHVDAGDEVDLAGEWEASMHDVSEVVSHVHSTHHSYAAIIGDANLDTTEGKKQLAQDEVYEHAESYVHVQFESEEMRRLLRNLEEPEIRLPAFKQLYKSKNVFPDWLLNTSEWKNTKGTHKGNDVSEILRIPPGQRTVEQGSILTSWLMSVWQTANVMGLKKCAAMLSEFKYIVYEPGENIITEGELGMTFYIITSGEVAVHKAGIGVVAHIGKGKSFGEIALTRGDVRTATIITTTKVEVLCLHKLDYDHFVKDIQQMERREHFFQLRECKLFASWTRNKIEKLCNTCARKIFESNTFIFKQGDEPDRVYIIMEGSVQIIKEVHIVCKNRWPVAMNSWDGTARRIVKPVVMQTLGKGAYFGELSIMKDTKRTASAFTTSKTTLIALDKLEFMHLVNHSKTSDLDELARGNKQYPQDQQILNELGHISGGPGSVAYSGSVMIQPNKVIRVPPVDPRAAHAKAMKETEAKASPSKSNAMGATATTTTATAPETIHLAHKVNYKKDYDGLFREAIMKKTNEENFYQKVKEAKRNSDDAEEEAAVRIVEEAANVTRRINPNPLKNVEAVHKHKGLKIQKKLNTRSTTSLVAAAIDDTGAAGDESRIITFSAKSMDRPCGGTWSRIRFGEGIDDNVIMPLVGVVMEERRVPPGVPNRRLRAQSEQQETQQGGATDAYQQQAWEEAYLQELLNQEAPATAAVITSPISYEKRRPKIADLKERLRRPCSYNEVLGLDS